MTIHRSVEFEQPDFMWQYMLRYERCVVAQYEVLICEIRLNVFLAMTSCCCHLYTWHTAVLLPLGQAVLADTSSNELEILMEQIFAVCMPLVTVVIIINSNKWSKNFDKRPYRREGVRFFTGDSVMWYWLQQSCYHAVIDDWMISFAVYTTAETASAFQWAS